MQANHEVERNWHLVQTSRGSSNREAARTRQSSWVYARGIASQNARDVVRDIANILKGNTRFFEH